MVNKHQNSDNPPHLDIPDVKQPCPPGIINLGNTCYINATLQCLLSIHPFVDWLLNTNSEIPQKSSASVEQRLTVILGKLFSAIYRGNYKKELQEFRDAIGVINTDFKEPYEQDAQEFLQFLLNRLHDENMTNIRSDERNKFMTSEVRRILSGVLHTGIECSLCDRAKTERKKNIFHKDEKASGKSNVFLFLTVPVPTLDETDLSYLGNGVKQKIIVNEILEGQTPLCHQRLLEVDALTDIPSVYCLLKSMPPVKSTPLPKPRSSRHKPNHSEPSARAAHLTADINIEDDFRTTSASSGRVKKNILSEDGLFMVHLNQQNFFDGHMENNYDQSLEPNDDENGFWLLLVHVTDSGQTIFPDDSVGAETTTHNPGFRRFSIPLTVYQRVGENLDHLRLSAVRSLLSFYHVNFHEHYGRIISSGWLQRLKFWIVDAGPGEIAEIDHLDEYPMLLPTVEASAVPLPEWLSPTGSKSQRLLRLLVVWPDEPPVDLLSTFQLSLDNSLQEFAVSSNRNSAASSSHATAASSDGGTGGQRYAAPGSSKNPNSTETPGLTIQKCLEAFFKPEQMDNTSSFKCPKCSKTQTSGLHCTYLQTAPNYLLLHLNRITHASASDPCPSGLKKVRSFVHYPIEGLDLSFMADYVEKGKRSSISKSNEEFIYDLVAVCCHKGTTESGHITAYCKNLFVDQWFHYNDHNVRKVTSDYVIQANAYILFYKRRGTYPDKLPLLARISSLVAPPPLTSQRDSPRSHEAQGTTPEYSLAASKTGLEQNKNKSQKPPISDSRRGSGNHDLTTQPSMEKVIYPTDSAKKKGQSKRESTV